ncbi:MAG: ABC transporter permease [Saprospiraceae bacterium]|nr:ABC transporter permease [Saprospiraceae bacterium]
MTTSDILRMAIHNLWRTRLRSSLTVLGVVIGIGALISMVAFGSGMEKNVTDAFMESGLFARITVSPLKLDMNRPVESLTDTSGVSVPLDDELLDRIRRIKGVKEAYGEIQQPAKVGLEGKETTLTYTGVDPAMGLKNSSAELIAGTFLTSDSMPQAVINTQLLRRLKIRLDTEDMAKAKEKDTAKVYTYVLPEDLIGDTLWLSTAVFNPMRMMGALMGNRDETPLSERRTPLIITGIRELEPDGPASRFGGDLLIPAGFASTIPSIGFNSITDFLRKGKSSPDKYAVIQVNVAGPEDITPVRAELESMGLNAFALAEQLKEVRRAFLAMKAVLGVVGFIALVVAGLGIINTLLMSILERTREIGIMKAIGGSEGQIKSVFFGEAAVIGLIGALGGIALGWLVTLAAGSFINMKIREMGETPMDLFYFPWWLLLGSIGFAIGLSLLAGLYPASRAARIDPVEALRWG